MDSNERHWIDNIADVVSGRMHNTVQGLRREMRTLKDRIQKLIQEKIIMTANEQKIIAAAEALAGAATLLSTGLAEKNAQIEGQRNHIAELEAQIVQMGQTPPTPPEDLSQEFTDLDSAVETVTRLASTLQPSPAGTPAGTPDQPTDGGGVADPTIDHSDNPDILIGGHEDPPAPGTGTGNTSSTPVEPAGGDDPSAPVEEGPVDGQPVADANDGIMEGDGVFTAPTDKEPDPGTGDDFDS